MCIRSLLNSICICLCLCVHSAVTKYKTSCHWLTKTLSTILGVKLGFAWKRLLSKLKACFGQFCYHGSSKSAESLCIKRPSASFHPLQRQSAKPSVHIYLRTSTSRSDSVLSLINVIWFIKLQSISMVQHLFIFNWRWLFIWMSEAFPMPPVSTSEQQRLPHMKAQKQLIA